MVSRFEWKETELKLTLTGRDGDAIGLLLDEIREHIAAGSDHLRQRRYVFAVEAAHQAELKRDEVETLLSSGGTALHWQSYRLLDTELKLLNRRIRLAIGI